MSGLDGSSVFPLLLFLAVLVGGMAVTYACGHTSTLLWRLASGTCIGLAAVGLVGLTLALQFGLRGEVVLAAAIVVGSPAFFLLSRERRAILKADAVRSCQHLVSLRRGALAARLLTFGAFGFLLWRVAARVMFVTADGIYTGASHNLGDLPFHLGVINSFAYGANLPPEHPSFAGVGFAYPFLADFVAAMFVVSGLSVERVLFWSTLFLCVALAVLISRLTLAITGDRTVALFAPMLALFSGGLGWWRFLEEAAAAGSLNLLVRLPHDYTITADHTYRWGNLLTSVLVTQRGMLLGLPMAIVVMHCWWEATQDVDTPDQSRRPLLLIAGTIAGLLPLVHAHSYAVLAGVGACLALLSTDKRAWLLFFAPALGIGLPQVWWLAQSGNLDSSAFIRWSVGWDHGGQNVFLFWIRNTGLVIPLLVAGLVWGRVGRGRRPLVSRPVLLWYLPFTLCFIGPNLVALAPWIWDNIKVLTYWYVASVPILALVLARLARGGAWLRATAVGLFIVLTLAGALDVWRVASGAFAARIFSTEDVAFADFVAGNTPARALILHAPVYNHPVVLTGRRSLMGYPGHLWSHGLDYRSREADIRAIYGGSAAAARLIEEYGIEFVVVGPHERSQAAVNDGFFKRYTEIGAIEGYRLFQTAERGGQRGLHGGASTN